MSGLPAAYPFITITINESGLIPVAQKSPGVIAIVGKAFVGPNEVTTTAANTPVVIMTPGDVAQFAQGPAANQQTALSNSLTLALEQNPAPSKIYAVRTAENDYASALQSLEAVDDVDFVALANETDITALGALKTHVETLSATGNTQMAVAMLDPTHAKATTYVNDVDTTLEPLKSAVGRMVIVAARGATVDAGTAAMAAIAGYVPQESVVLKPVRGVTMPLASQYSPSEIIGLAQKGINPIISPALMVGGGFYFGDARTYSSDAALQFIDIVRVLDDIDFKLKAGLVGAIGDDRITKSGLTLILSRTEGIMDPMVSAAEIDDYTIDIPLLDILIRPESTWSPGDTNMVTTARANRQITMYVNIVYGPAVHQIQVQLVPGFS